MLLNYQIQNIELIRKKKGYWEVCIIFIQQFEKTTFTTNNQFCGLISDDNYDSAWGFPRQDGQ